MNRVKQILKEEQFLTDEEVCNISPNSNLINDLYMDDLDVINFSMELEREFDLLIEDKTISSWITLQDVINTLESNGAKIEYNDKKEHLKEISKISQEEKGSVRGRF